MMLKSAILLLAIFAALSYAQEEENDKEKETVKVLNLSNQGITSLDGHNFSKYHDLKEVDLSNNDIKDLHEDVFLGNNNLKKLNLSGNKHLELPQYSTLLNANIEEIDLSNCNIERLPTNIFDGSRDLKIINISYNPLIEEDSVKEFTLNNLMEPQKLILPYVDEIMIKKICNEVDITIEIKADDYSDSILCKDVRDGTWQNIPKESEGNLNIEKRDEEETGTNNDDTQPEPQEEVVEPSKNEVELEKPEDNNNNEETDTENHENKDVNAEEVVEPSENETELENTEDNNNEKTDTENHGNKDINGEENTNNGNENVNAGNTINNEDTNAENPINNEKTEDNNNGEADNTDNDSQTGNTADNSDAVNLENTDNVASPNKPETQNENEVSNPPPAEAESEIGSSDVKVDENVPDAVDGKIQLDSEPGKNAGQETSNTENQGQANDEEKQDVSPPSLQRGVLNVPPQQTENVIPSENKEPKKSEDIQQGKADETKAEETGGAGSSILVILVVAVVIAGAVAFGYKFYKTRTYQAARTTEPVEHELKEIVIDKRPNGTSKQDNAIEEKEEEPLMETQQRESSVEIKEIDETNENDVSKDENVNKSSNQPTGSPYVPTTTPIKPPNPTPSPTNKEDDKTQI